MAALQRRGQHLRECGWAAVIQSAETKLASREREAGSKAVDEEELRGDAKACTTPATGCAQKVS